MKKAYRIQVCIFPEKWKNVGLLYGTKEAAEDWLSFVQKAWNACDARVVEVELPETRKSSESGE